MLTSWEGDDLEKIFGVIIFKWLGLLLLQEGIRVYAIQSLWSGNSRTLQRVKRANLPKPSSHSLQRGAGRGKGVRKRNRPSVGQEWVNNTVTKGNTQEAPANTEPAPKAKNCLKSSELLRLRLKQKASHATGFPLFVPILKCLYHVWVISISKKKKNRKKRELDYKGLHESNKIIWKMWPTKTRREFNLQLTEELIRKDWSCCCHNTQGQGKSVCGAHLEK